MTGLGTFFRFGLLALILSTPAFGELTGGPGGNREGDFFGRGNSVQSGPRSTYRANPSPSASPKPSVSPSPSPSASAEIQVNVNVRKMMLNTDKLAAQLTRLGYPHTDAYASAVIEVMFMRDKMNFMGMALMGEDMDPAQYFEDQGELKEMPFEYLIQNSSTGTKIQGDSKTTYARVHTTTPGRHGFVGQVKPFKDADGILTFRRSNDPYRVVFDVEADRRYFIVWNMKFYQLNIAEWTRRFPER